MKLKFNSLLMIFLLILLCSSKYLTYGCNSKFIYLTFDDGPSTEVTSDVLNILEKENVPATFFIIGNQIKGKEDLILRMKNEGHSIGLHSYTHIRSNLYNNNNDFLKEMLLTQEALFDVTGENYNILRFPFGTNNLTYNITNEMVDLLHNNDLKIYDWTLDSGDGANSNLSPYLIFKNSISSNSNITLLMHCSSINSNSAAALSDIIKYYKDNNYIFKKIDSTTEEIFKIKNENI